MGKRDIETLNKICCFANAFCKLAGLPFRFKEDAGDYETAIVFNEEAKTCRIPESHEDWDKIPYPEALICPDISDYDNRIIFEYEEEGQKKRPGARLTSKGHGPEGDISNKRDTRRNQFYLDNNFYLLRIWESQLKLEIIWKIRVIEFILNCYKKKGAKSIAL